MNKYKILSIILAFSLLGTGLFMNPVEEIAYHKQKLINYLNEGYKPITPNTHVYLKIKNYAGWGAIKDNTSQSITKSRSPHTF
jgi:hypothetical protein